MPPLSPSRLWPAPVRGFGLGLYALLLAGCQLPEPLMLGSAASRTPSELASAHQAQELHRTKQVLDVSTVTMTPLPTISAVGYSVISSQPGKTLNQRRLMAIRAARMEAMRDLTEQIHGLTIESETALSESVLQSDTMRAHVAGAVRGARTVKIEPKGADTYSVKLEIDRATIDQLLKSARRWRL